MAGPKAEWLIWDKRFQFGYSCLNQRLNDIEQATQQIAQLDQQTKHLAASSKHLQEDNDGLRDRIRRLEQDSHQIAQVKEQVQDLTASCTQLKEENNDLKDRILQLEQEGTYRDEKDGLVQEELKEKLSVQKDELKSVVKAMGGMNETARLERGQREEEIQQLSSQVEALFATRHTLEWQARNGKSREPAANTNGEWMPINQHAEQQHQPNAAYQDIEVQGVLIPAQTSSTLFENHLRYAEKVFERYETEAVQAFLSGLQERYQLSLRKKLEEHGEWTWQAAIKEGDRMVAAEKKTKRRSVRLKVGASQPS